MTTTGPADLLLGPDAQGVLDAALAGEGLRAASWERHAVHARPGAETSVGFAVRAVSVRGAGIAPRELYLVATTADLPGDAPGIARLTGADGRTVSVWAHPADPALPALGTATTPALLGDLLRAAGDAGTVTDLGVVAYRPLRRAVTVAATPVGRRWAKALRPDVAAGLVHRLDLLRAAGVRVPATVAHAPGLVVLADATGRPLADHLHAGAAPAPGAVLDLLDALPVAATALPARRTPADRLDRYADALARALPDAPVRAVAADVAAVLADSDPGPVVATHGDLHPANLWWDGRPGAGALGLIDVDTLGPGRRVDDLACLVAHLTVLPTLDPGYHRVPGLRDAFLAASDRVVDPDALRARAAAVLLSLAASRPAEHLARTWLDQARELVRRPSTAVPVPHRGTLERRAS